MKKILNNMAAALVLMAGVAFCTVSCQEDPITGPAEFSIVDTIVEVPAEGGEFSATYFLENPVLGEEVHPTCSDSWVSGFNTLTAYEITFTVSANMTEGVSREAVVNVEYNGENFSFTVSQDAFEDIVDGYLYGDNSRYYGAIQADSTVANYFVVLTNEAGSQLGVNPNSVYYALDLYGELWPEDGLDKIGLPEGTYTLDSENTQTSGTFSSQYSYFFGYDENEELIDTQYFSRGTLDVVRDGENYNLELIIYFEDGSSHHVTYSGPVNLSM